MSRRGVGGGGGGFGTSSLTLLLKHNLGLGGEIQGRVNAAAREFRVLPGWQCQQLVDKQ